MKILWGICGSFCNHQAILNLLETNEKIKEFDIQFVISENCAECDTRFMESSQLIQRLESISGKKVFTSIVQAETVGPYADYELFVIAPCTASTLSHLANGCYDHSVALCAKAMLRNQKPVVLAIASNDILSASSVNLFTLLQRKLIYVVPFYQDGIRSKPYSCISEFSLIYETIMYALKGKQIQPLLHQKGASDA